MESAARVAGDGDGLWLWLLFVAPVVDGGGTSAGGCMCCVGTKTRRMGARFRMVACKREWMEGAEGAEGYTQPFGMDEFRGMESLGCGLRGGEERLDRAEPWFHEDLVSEMEMEEQEELACSEAKRRRGRRSWPNSESEGSRSRSREGWWVLWVVALGSAEVEEE